MIAEARFKFFDKVFPIHSKRYPYGVFIKNSSLSTEKLLIKLVKSSIC